MDVDRERLATPVPGDEPSGPWLRRDPLYAEIQEAIRVEAGDPDYGIEEKRADWVDAARLCVGTLSERTKDFYLGTVMLEALARVDGPTGLAHGLWFLAEIHERFWDDFHPRPRDEGRDVDGRLNQIDALLRRFKTILDNVPMGTGEPRMSWLEWRHAGGALPSGAPCEYGVEDKDTLRNSTSWDDYDQGVRAMREAVEQLDRLDDCIDRTYPPEGVPSLRDIKEALSELVSAYEALLTEKGPSPHEMRAQELLAQTGCGFLEAGWLAELVRAGLPTSRALNSLQAAVADEYAGMAPEEGWAAHLTTCWNEDRSYEQKSTPPEEPAPPPPGEAPAPGSEPGVTAPGQPVPQAGAPAAHAAPPPPPPPPPPGGDMTASLAAAARALRAADPGEPASYLAVRMIRWPLLNRLNPGEQPPGPGDPLRTHLNSLFEQGQWPQLLEACEQALETQVGSAGWLDLQRYACAAMRQVGGPPGDRPREEVVEALGALLKRHRWLLDATLADGQPAADEITRNWLEVEVLGGSAETAAPAGGGAGAGGAGGSDGEPAALVRARELMESDGLEAAMAELQQARGGASAPRTSAMLDLGMSELCLSGGRADLGVPILEGLATKMRESQPLSQWEGTEMLARILEALYHGYSQTQDRDPTGNTASRKQAVADELAMIDMPRRLRLDAP